MEYIFNYKDVIPYAVLVILFLLLGNAIKNEINKARAAFVLLFLFASLRYGIGYDFFSYQKIAYGIVDDDRIEPLARMLLHMAGGENFQIFIAITSFLCLYPIYKVSECTIGRGYESLLIFLFFPVLFLESLSIIRHAVAISFVLISYYYLFKNKLLAILYYFIAIGFHKAASIALIIYLIVIIKPGFKLNVLLYISILIFGQIIGYYIVKALPNNNTTNYIMNYIYMRGDGGRVLTYAINIIAVFNLVFWRKIKENSKSKEILLSIINTGFCLWNAFLFVDYTIALRLSTLFITFSVLLYPTISVKIRLKNIKISVKNVFYIYLFLLFIASFVVNIHANLISRTRISYLPYELFFMQ